MYLIGNARRLAAEQQHIARPVGEAGIGGGATGGEQKKTPPFAPSPSLEGREGGMAHPFHRIHIIHAGTPEGGIANGKAGWLDDVDGHAEAGPRAQARAGILGDVRAIEGEDQRTVSPCRIVGTVNTDRAGRTASGEAAERICVAPSATGQDGA